MSSVKIQGSATGTAVFTIAVPDGTSTDRTINLPDAAGSFVLDDGSGNVDITGTVTAERLTADASGEAILSLNGYTASQNTEVQLVAVRDDVSTSKSLLDIKTNDGTSLVRRMRITSDGNVGIGTTSPYHNLQVAGTIKVATGNAQGVLALGDGNGSTNNVAIWRGSANAPTTDGNLLNFGAYSGIVFAVGNTSIGSQSERMRLDGNGHLCINQTDAVMASRTCKIAINQDNATGFGLGINNIRNDTSGSGGIVTKNNEVSGTFDVMSILNSGGTEIGIINANNSAVGFTSTSDYRLKENVVELTGAIDRVKTLQPKRFNFISDPDVTVDGFIAHEVSDAVPEAVTGTKDAMRDEQYEVTPAVLDDDGNVVTEAVMGTRQVPKYQGIDPAKLVPLLTAAIKEQQALIEDLQTRIAALEAV